MKKSTKKFIRKESLRNKYEISEYTLINKDCNKCGSQLAIRGNVTFCPSCGVIW